MAGGSTRRLIKEGEADSQVTPELAVLERVGPVAWVGGFVHVAFAAGGGGVAPRTVSRQVRTHPAAGDSFAKLLAWAERTTCMCFFKPIEFRFVLSGRGAVRPGEP
jgi:hypothetical protein